LNKIEHVTARQVEVPLTTPVWLGGSAVRSREYCVIELTASSGENGHAIVFTRGADLANIVIRQLAPVLVGKQADMPEQLWMDMYHSVRLNGRQGALMRAISLADIAIWDLLAKRAGAPLYRLLGGYRDTIPVMMAGGYYNEGKGIPELCEEFLQYVEQGYKRLKLVVGGVSMDDDLARFIAVRNSLPEDIELGIDANGAWDDPKAVRRWIDKADGETCGLSFAEEPLPPEQRADLAKLREAVQVPLAVGEFLAGRWTFREYMEAGCIDIVRADATLCGGITEWRKIAALANAWNLPIIPHYFASLHLHTALALPGCQAIEVVSKDGLNSSVHLLGGRSYEWRQGVAVPTNAPGLGLQLDEEFIQAHTTKQVSTRDSSA
jgi:D-arabinonate dehydratase